MTLLKIFTSQNITSHLILPLSAQLSFHVPEDHPRFGHAKHFDRFTRASRQLSCTAFSKKHLHHLDVAGVAGTSNTISMPPKAAVKAVSVTTSTSTTTDTVPSTLTSLEAYALLALSGICLAILASTLNGPGAPLATSIAFSGLAFAITFALIRWLGPSFMRVGLKGKDMSKVRKIEMCVEQSSIPRVYHK